MKIVYKKLLSAFILFLTANAFCSDSELPVIDAKIKIRIYQENQDDLPGLTYYSAVNTTTTFDLKEKPTAINSTLISNLSYALENLLLIKKQKNIEYQLEVFDGDVSLQKQTGSSADRFNVHIRKENNNIHAEILKHDRMTAASIGILFGIYVFGVWSGNLVRKAISGAIIGMLTRAGVTKKN